MSILVKEGFGWSLSVGMMGRDGELGEDVPGRDRLSVKGQRWDNKVSSGNSKSDLSGAVCWQSMGMRGIFYQ